MKANSKQLPRVEWNFSELDDEEISEAFYYEYGRQSEFVKTAVAKIRAWMNAKETIESGCSIGSRFYDVLWWLGYEPSFPNTSWLSLKANTILEINKQRADEQKKKTEINAMLPPGERCCGGGIAGQPGDPVEAIEWMVRALRSSRTHLRFGGAGFHHVRMADSKSYGEWQKKEAESLSELVALESEIVPVPEVSRIWGAIDWNATDAEIIEALKWFLSRSRPAEFRHCAKTPRGQQGFNNSFPFRMKSALEWLGVLRRYEDAKSWREYMELYNPAALKKLGKNTVKSRDISEFAIPREADCRKAKLILEWFDKGTQLKKKNFE
jgi:hypothetical protein